MYYKDRFKNFPKARHCKTRAGGSVCSTEGFKNLSDPMLTDWAKDSCAEAIPPAELLGSSHSWIKATAVDLLGNQRENEAPSATEAADRLVRCHRRIGHRRMQPGGYPLQC